MTELEMKTVVKENSLFYVYVIMDPKQPGSWKYLDHIFLFKPLYVGKGKGRRIHAHYNKFNSANIIKDNTLRKRKEEGFTKCYDFVFLTCSEEEALAYETSLILTIGRLSNKTGILTNLLEKSGAGAGRSPSKETREKLRAWNLSDANPLRGVPRTPEVKEKIGNTLRGRIVSQETRDKLSEVNSGINSSWWGKFHTEETKKIQKRFNIDYRYEILTPQGEVLISYSLPSFCREHEGLSSRHLGATYTGKRNHNRGYRIISRTELEDNWMESELFKEYLLIEEKVEAIYATAA